MYLLQISFNDESSMSNQPLVISNGSLFSPSMLFMLVGFYIIITMEKYIYFIQGFTHKLSKIFLLWFWAILYMNHSISF